jgi:hypothetical protein
MPPITIYVCTDIVKSTIAFLLQAYTRKVPIALYVSNPNHWDDLLWHKTLFLPHQIGNTPDHNHIAIFDLNSPYQPNTRCVRVCETPELLDLYAKPQGITLFVTQIPTEVPKDARVYIQDKAGWTTVSK